MSFEALVDMRDEDSMTHKKGNIICVGMNDSPWGNIDVRHFIRILMEDTDIESKLSLKSDDYPTMSYPYAKYDSEGSMVNMSIYRFDISLFSNDTAVEFDTTLSKMQDHITPTPILWKKNIALGKDNPFTLSDMILDDSEYSSFQSSSSSS